MTIRADHFVAGIVGIEIPQADTDDREMHMLQPHVVVHKLHYLRRITLLRAANAMLLHVDKACVNKNHPKTKSLLGL